METILLTESLFVRVGINYCAALIIMLKQGGTSEEAGGYGRRSHDG